jgi:hypothetical protein
MKVIDEVGGVDVDVLHPIVDDNYPDDVGANANNPYALKRLYLAPGPQHLDGATALNYVRSRHADLVGDFGRSVRQQQVLSAMKTKLANPNIFNKLSAIANDMSGSLKTDMALTDVLSLMTFARNLDINNMTKLVLGPGYSHSGKSSGGEDVVIPDCSAIIPAIAKMLNLGSKAVCNVGDSGASATTSVDPTPVDPTPVASTSVDPTPVASTSVDPTPVDSTPTLPSALGDALGSDTDAMASLGNTVNTSIASLACGSNSLYGVSSLLDLMFMGVFETTNVF